MLPNDSPWGSDPDLQFSPPGICPPGVPTEYLLQIFRSAVQSTSAMVTSAKPGNSFLESSSQVGARFLQCPHLEENRGIYAEIWVKVSLFLLHESQQPQNPHHHILPLGTHDWKSCPFGNLWAHFHNMVSRTTGWTV